MEIITILDSNGAIVGSVAINDNAPDNMANTIEDYKSWSDINRKDMKPIYNAMKQGCSEWSMHVHALDSDGSPVLEEFSFTSSTLLS
jgi:hypothetical protein